MSDSVFEQLRRGISKILAIKETDPEMDLVSLDSSAIDFIEYDYVAKILQVTFNSGATYGYANVSQETVEDLINASSVGREFVSEIRNDYLYWRIS